MGHILWPSRGAVIVRGSRCVSAVLQTPQPRNGTERGSGTGIRSWEARRVQLWHHPPGLSTASVRAAQMHVGEFGKPVDEVKAPTGLCADGDLRCAAWAGSGECTKNPKYMLSHCRSSCRACDEDRKE